MPMTQTANEAAIDAIIATCDGDMRGAISVLLRVNEQLVTELKDLYAAFEFEHDSPSERRVQRLLH
jgi:DNA polymerase III delta prime subunit